MQTGSPGLAGKTPGATRREFLKQMVFGACVAGLGLPGWPAISCAADCQGVPRRPLGNTGEEVAILGVGGWHVGAMSDDREAIRLVRAAIDQGATFLDNA